MTCLSAAEHDILSMTEHTASMCLPTFAKEVQLCLHLLLACRLSAAKDLANHWHLYWLQYV